MSTVIEDLRGEPVAVGDTIAYACHDGRSAGMRIGTVVEIVEAGRRQIQHHRKNVAPAFKDYPTMVRVSVEHTNKVDTKRMVSLIHADMKRFVKVSQ